MRTHILVFNAGSSSLKFALFDRESLEQEFYGQVDSLHASPSLMVYDVDGDEVYDLDGFDSGFTSAIKQVLEWCEEEEFSIDAVGHRIVHGGKEYSKPVTITGDVLDNLKALIPLAPLHQPYNVEVIEAFAALHPDIPQIACFDTAFHRTQVDEAAQFALPASYTDEGMIRYGFHGLSYEYIASVLPRKLGKEQAQGKVVVAHLGNGASMCAMQAGVSKATTMGFTPLDGLMMGTRAGNIDPGLLLHLQTEKNMDLPAIAGLLYHQSGLLGVSGESSDMRQLLKSSSPEAKKAIAMFCYRAASQLLSLLPAVGGLDALVFTGGIGEHASPVRASICKHLAWMGLSLDSNANAKSKTIINDSSSKIKVLVLPTNEAQMIAQHTVAQL